MFREASDTQQANCYQGGEYRPGCGSGVISYLFLKNLVGNFNLYYIQGSGTGCFVCWCSVPGTDHFFVFPLSPVTWTETSFRGLNTIWERNCLFWRMRHLPRHLKLCRALSNCTKVMTLGFICQIDVFSYRYNEISNNATYLHIIDNKISTNYDGFFVIILYISTNIFLQQKSNHHQAWGHIVGAVDRL